MFCFVAESGHTRTHPTQSACARSEPSRRRTEDYFNVACSSNLSVHRVHQAIRVPSSGAKATCTIIGLPIPNVRSLAKPSLTLVECPPSLTLVECLRMILQGLTASWYPAGLRCPCRSILSLNSRDPPPAPTYPYALRHAILHLWRPRG